MTPPPSANLMISYICSMVPSCPTQEAFLATSWISNFGFMWLELGLGRQLSKRLRWMGGRESVTRSFMDETWRTTRMQIAWRVFCYAERLEDSLFIV